MKKISLRLKTLGVALVALFFGGIASSCSHDAIIESVTTDVEYFTVTNDMWDIDDKGDFYCSFQWNAISDDVIRNGNVSAYLLEVSNGVERQNPLPYIYAIDHIDTAGNVVYEPLNIRFDIEPGYISFVASDVANYFTTASQLLTMRFRVVINKPVNYVIEQ